MQLFDISFIMSYQVALCQKRIKEQHEKDKLIYANMFQRFAERDSKVMGAFSTLSTRGYIFQTKKLGTYNRLQTCDFFSSLLMNRKKRR